MRRFARIEGITLAAAFSAICGSAQNLEVVDLGANVFPSAINSQGVVVGNVNAPPISPLMPPMSWPFVWQSGVLTTITPVGWTGGSLASISSDGTAVGQAQLADPSHPTAPFIYKAGVITFIPIGNQNGAAGAINDNGVIGGSVFGFSGTVPFLFANGTLTLLQALGGFGGGITGINRTGIAVGAVTDTSHATVATMWAPPDYALQVLPQIGGNNAGANAINDQGTIAGYSSTTTQVFPGLFQTHAVLWENGQNSPPIDIGSVPGAIFTTAWGINNSGVVVGNASNFTGMNVGFIYQNGTIQTLNDLASASTGWTFWFARAINDNGDVTGVGIPPNATSAFDLHGFILRTAKPTPAQMIAMLATKVDSYGLNPGLAQSLKSKLDSVRDSLGKPGPAACNQLGAFVNEISAQAGKSLTAAQANELRSGAEKLAAVLSC
jgi:probable HAF family extracellular repeat protein